MPTLITAGDATTGLVQTAASDGALTLQTGPAGSKVNAIALSSAGGATFTQITGGALTLATAQATTSGTSIDFTSIPSWVKRITVMFNAVSTNGTSYMQIQVGSGGVSTAGYASQFSGGAAFSNVMATGFGVASMAAASAFTGSVTLCLIGSNTWIEQGHLAYVSGSAVGWSSGGSSPSLSGALDRIRITTVNGTDAFDAGSVNIMYEG